MDKNGVITMDEMKILSYAFAKGISHLTKCQISSRNEVMDLVTHLFRKIDVSDDDCLSLEE